MTHASSWSDVWQVVENAENDESVGAVNLEDLRAVLHDKQMGNKPHTGYQYASDLKIIFRYIDYRLKDADEDDLRRLMQAINDSDIAVNTDEYTYKSKKSKVESLQAFFGYWRDDDDAWRDIITTNYLRGQHSRTHPSEIPSVDDIKRILQELDNWKYKALLFSHYDAATRIGEIIKCRVKDFSQDDGRYRLFIRGNKESSDRMIEMFVAGPVIELFLNRFHPLPDDPEAMLFPKHFQQGPDHMYESPGGEAIRHHLRRLDLELDADYQKTHLWRKRRKIFLKSVKGLPEIVLARRMGKVPGASNDAYDRISQTEANNEYAASYGIAVEDDQRRDLVPLVCEDCSLTNPGWRDRCLDCHGLLEIEEVEDMSVVDKVLDQLEAIELAGRDVDIEDQEELVRDLVRRQLESE